MRPVVVAIDQGNKIEKLKCKGSSGFIHGEINSKNASDTKLTFIVMPSAVMQVLKLIVIYILRS